jgi:dCTP deaminase
MILTDREIAIALQCAQIKLEPPPPPESYSSTSVDLTLADNGLIWDSAAGVQIRPGHPNYKYTNLRSQQKHVKLTGYSFAPRSFLLAWTRETLHLPETSRLAARVEGKSSIARLGIGIHITAPTIHAGFRGQIQLEMYNFGPHEVVLDEGLKICQLIFEQTSGTPEKGYAGMFVGQQASP